MEQSELHYLESKCIQESPPPCITACPLHVDIRAMMSAVQRRDMTAALMVLRKTLPFPAVIGRICDQPCQAGCNRRSIGGALQVGALERACADLSLTLSPGTILTPALPHKIAIVGSSLSGLTAAHDLARKGYQVTILEATERLGGSLWDYPEAILPQPVISSSTSMLERYRVQSSLNTPVRNYLQLDDLFKSYSAVFLDSEVSIEDNRGYGADQFPVFNIDPVTLATGRAGIFGGRRPLNHQTPKVPFSPVLAMAEGRRGAVSIDRYLQKASLTASRFNEGPYPSKLYTNLQGIETSPAVPVTNPASGFSLDEAVREAGRCLSCECLECVKSCVYLKQFGAFPRRYIRQIYNNEAIAMGGQSSNKLVNSCTLCGLCEEICPDHLAMQNVCLEARRSMVKRGKMPPSAFEFALLDMQFSRSEHFTLVRHAPGFSTSSYVFFPGCQLSASDPAAVQRVYDYLLTNLARDTGLVLDCCGAPALWAGQEELFRQTLENFHSLWLKMGKPGIIVACSTCYQIFRDNLADVPVVSLWEILDGLPPRVPDIDRPALTLAVHDPCTTRHQPKIQTAVRSLLRKYGVQIEELNLSGSKTECCGFGGLVQISNPDLASAIVNKRSAESPRDYLAYCAMCRDSLAKTGKKVFYLLDIVCPAAAGPALSPAQIPGWSVRRENRMRLKETLLKEKWQQEVPALEEYRKINLRIDSTLSAVLEKRRILIEDLQQVIEFAERTGSSFVNPRNGHLTASFKPRSVTFWVEYSQLTAGFTVYNAYSHRMEVARS